MHGGGLELALVFLLAAVIAVPVFKRVRLGAVLGDLVAGGVVGPFGLRVVGDAAPVVAGSGGGGPLACPGAAYRCPAAGGAAVVTGTVHNVGGGYRREWAPDVLWSSPARAERSVRRCRGNSRAKPIPTSCSATSVNMPSPPR